MERLFRNILVDVDANAAVQPALEVAARAARRWGAEVSVVDVASGASMGLLRSEPLAASVRTAREAAVSVQRPQAEALIDEVERFDHDLVIRSRARDLGAGAEVTTRLFRDCPCAVWSLGPAPFGERPKIVAAVNAGSEDSAIQERNRNVLDTALSLADAEGGQVTAVYTWHPPAQKKLYSLGGGAELEAAVAEAEARAAADLEAVAGPYGVRTKLLHGDVAEAIGTFAVQSGADLVVTGPLGGSGLWQALFGSTAERLLETTPCSVLAGEGGAVMDARGTAPSRSRLCAGSLARVGWLG